MTAVVKNGNFAFSTSIKAKTFIGSNATPGSAGTATGGVHCGGGGGAMSVCALNSGQYFTFMAEREHRTLFAEKIPTIGAAPGSKLKVISRAVCFW